MSRILKTEPTQSEGALCPCNAASRSQARLYIKSLEKCMQTMCYCGVICPDAGLMGSCYKARIGKCADWNKADEASRAAYAARMKKAESEANTTQE